VASFLSSLRYLLSDFIGEDDAAPPFLPDGLPTRRRRSSAEGTISMDYQSASYARLYVDRLRRFVGRQDVDASRHFCEIARRMADRMSYEDPIRIAQLKLAESGKWCWRRARFLNRRQKISAG